MRLTHGRGRLVPVVATLLTAVLPAMAWAQSPSVPTATTAPEPSVAASPAATSAAPSAIPGGSASPAASPGASPSATPLWTPPAASGPIALLTAGLEGDTRAQAIEDAFGDTLDESCPQAILDPRNGDSAEAQAEQARAAIAAGAKVLVLDPVDPAAAGALVTEAQGTGATVIALGGAITGGVPDVQVAYDEAATGSLIGAVVVQVAEEAAEPDPDSDATPIPSDVPVERVVLIGGPAGDAVLATWLANVKEGLGSRATIVHEAAVEELSAEEGQRVVGEAIGALTADGFGAVITPSDAVAAGVITGLREAGITPAERSVTGLGASLAGLQAIVVGDQLLTTWAPEVAAANVAAVIACGEATGAGMPQGLTTTPVDNGAGEVPTVQLTAIVVHQDGSVEGTRSVEATVVEGEAFGPDTVAMICTPELAQACDDLGLIIPSPSPAPSGSPVVGSPAPASPDASPAAASPPASPAAGSPATGSPAPSGAPTTSVSPASPAAS